MRKVTRLVSVLAMAALLVCSFAFAETEQPDEADIFGAVDETIVAEVETAAEETVTEDVPLTEEDIPDSAIIIGSLADQLDPNRRIDIYADWEGEGLYLGSKVTLMAVLHGYDNAVYTLQWQESPDDVHWTDMDGATGAKIEIVLDENNWANFWRVAVVITDVTTD